MAPKAVIFDLLTALLDSWGLWDTAAGDKTAGLRWRKRYLELTFGCGAYRPYADLVQESARDTGLPSAAPNTLLNTWDQLQPWPEVTDVLHRLKARGYRVGVVSNCSRDLGYQAVARCGASFDAIVMAEDAGFYKPRPEAYARILSELGVEAHDALFVAGSNGDVVGAAGVGMEVVWHNRIGLPALPGSAPLIEGSSLPSVLRPLLGCEGLLRSEIPTPSLYLNRRVFENNCLRMHQRAKELNAQFRVHIKTHKTVEGTELEVKDTDGRIACSTIKEIEHIQPLIRKGTVRSILYGVPPVKSSIQRLAAMRKRLPAEYILMVDHPSQIDLIPSSFSTQPWPIFINIDCGTKREGLPLGSDRLNCLIAHALQSTQVSIHGFYCHSGHSYRSNNLPDAEEHLFNEISCASAAANLCLESKQDLNLVLSVGATPTAHAASSTITQKLANLPGTPELHAGNFAILDLQQVSTGLVDISHVASWIEAEVNSVYPDRGEVLINLGCLGIGREPGREAGVWGRAMLVSEGTAGSRSFEWDVVRISQEHGIIAPRTVDADVRMKMVNGVVVGSRVRIIPQHACIAGAMHDSYVVVDEDDGRCVGEWARCRGW
ncbi:hypothetical protein ASPWEDRAFT_53282 [Aspergillus wentii DTO 134E9]|uniref:D-serine dehydratase n=1 Tax=Aspergillus wentii DTO 134E9 TaxID=1073089 RepID=A0A1L9RE95_ASPWE|nr:uncharacterized protein ASPWEDRAFT_53282 [Aspergillus wentii DTO 134E9]KAI9933513.1 hypothetical protein MW887_007986 [Aspergillus wentii]OJJ33259.1 hypothetical protein ASPWEDRAFT_53282 [Aspergillus wentii DTO 134E9]